MQLVQTLIVTKYSLMPIYVQTYGLFLATIKILLPGSCIELQALSSKSLHALANSQNTTGCLLHTETMENGVISDCMSKICTYNLHLQM